MSDSDEGTSSVGRSPAVPYFAVVIGSGFGGAVTACRLAQARATLVDPASRERALCLLERGRRYDRQDFPRLRLPDYLTSDPDRLTSKRVPDLGRLLWSHDQGLWELRNLGELRVAQAAGLGGGSLIYASVHLRPPDQVFASWPRGDGCGAGDCACAGAPAEARAPFDRQGLRRYYEQVAEMLDATPLPAALQQRYPKAAAMAGCATALAPGDGAGGDRARFFHPPLAVRFAGTAPPLDPRGRNRFGREQGDCTGCGNCTIGCQEGAKNTLDLNYLAVAEDLGVEVRTLCEVQSIRAVRGPTACVEVRLLDHLDPADDGPLYAEYVFLCAGAVGSTEILMRSRELDAPLDAGPRLGHSFFANGDNLGAVFDTRAALCPGAGPTITTTLLHVGPAATWFLLQDGGLPPSLAEGMGLFRSPLWLARNRFLPPGFVPRGGSSTKVAPRARPGMGAVDRMIERAQVLLAGAFGAADGPLHPPAHPTAALARGLRQLVPAALDPLLERVRGLDRVARQQLWRINARVIRKMDQRLKGRLLTTPLAPLRALIAREQQMVTLVGEALAEEYPLIADLFAPERAMDLALSVGRALLFGGPPSDHSALLLVMGPDQKGTLIHDRGYLRILWNDQRNLPLYGLQERLLRDAATHLGGELRTNPDWTLGRTPLSVHAQGGCGMSADQGAGVTRPCGQLWACDRVYVMDAAAFPGSVGVNPSASIAAVAERNVQLFIRKTWGLDPSAYLHRFARPVAPTSAERAREIRGYDRLLAPELPPPIPEIPRARPVGLCWDEEMAGQVAPDPVAGPRLFAELDQPLPDQELPWPRRPDIRPFLAAERRAPLDGLRLGAELSVSIEDLDAFLLEARPRMAVRGHVTVLRRLGRRGPGRERFPAQGHLYFDLQADPRRPASRVWAQDRRLSGMSYALTVAGPGGRPLAVRARKLIADDPGMDMWADLSTVYLVARDETRWWLGVMHVQLSSFLRTQLRDMRLHGGGAAGGPPLDDVARGWAFLRFASFFVGGVKNVYSQWL